MNKFKDKEIEEDIFVDAESSNTSIVNVTEIVQCNNKNDFDSDISSIDKEREVFSKKHNVNKN